MRIPTALLLACLATLTTAVSVGVLSTLVHASNQTPQSARVKISPQTTLQSIRALPPTAQIETRRGTVVSPRRFAEVADAIRAAQARPRVASPANFSRTAAAATVKIRNGTHVPSLLSRPDSDVIELPNGKRLTVGDMKKLAQVSPQMRDRPLATSARGDLSGPATKISSARELANLRNAPDSTVLENRHGVRITLGELRARARSQR